MASATCALRDGFHPAAPAETPTDLLLADGFETPQVAAPGPSQR